VRADRIGKRLLVVWGLIKNDLGSRVRPKPMNIFDLVSAFLVSQIRFPQMEKTVIGLTAKHCFKPSIDVRDVSRWSRDENGNFSVNQLRHDRFLCGGLLRPSEIPMSSDSVFEYQTSSSGTGVRIGIVIGVSLCSRDFFKKHATSKSNDNSFYVIMLAPIAAALKPTAVVKPLTRQENLTLGTEQE
jgi:hypothetical protein